MKASLSKVLILTPFIYVTFKPIRIFLNDTFMSFSSLNIAKSAVKMTIGVLEREQSRKYKTQWTCYERKVFILNNGSVKKQPVVNNIHVGECNAETSLNLVKCLVRNTLMALLGDSFCNLLHSISNSIPLLL